ncbi:MBL fold metallo-hydrolase [Flavicella sediminum]|uniref:MBL fold metallo-hydrolase n=1 Tax=Flavicella sediminum TaxID=2585141 RepID=UPI0011223136|nr:MBL fold metallo-hydrolase [Flavicella sediminum]
MKITFLGTGTSQGVPMILSNHPVNSSKDLKDNRLRSSVLVSWNEFSYLIDCGPDFRQQVLRAEVKNINGILFTHEHSDHIAGLDDIRPYCYKIGAMPIYAQKRVMTCLEKRYDYIFQKENRYPGAAQVEENIIEDQVFELNGITITPINLLHGTLEIFGYRFDNFAYLTDIKYIKEEEKEKLKNLEVLVVSAIRYEPHPTHFNVEEALAFIEEIKPKKAYITHISHMLGFHKEVSKALPENVYLSYDGLELEI